MYRKSLIAIGLAASLLLSACVTHNIPTAKTFTETDWPNTARLFVDANGDFYPDNWSTSFPANRIESRHSLRMAAPPTPAAPQILEAARREQLREIASLVAGKRRVFVLVHGFNNNQDSAEDAFAVLRPRLGLTGEDAVIHFHWDGLVGSGVGRGTMWFKAVGYSQVAGTHALRDVFRLLSQQEVIVISHSRGASVVLSALSDPAYDEDFWRRTNGVLGSGFLSRAPLEPASNNIHVLLLAPAIGNPDFWSRGGGTSADCSTYRTFPPQLRSIRYSINPEDPVLEKPLGGRLAASFNATDFGYRESVGRALEQCYNSRRPGQFVMRGYPIRMNAHPFVSYAAHPVVATMLADSGISAAQ